jgi:membrane-associated phospholipid phosphatase
VTASLLGKAHPPETGLRRIAGNLIAWITLLMRPQRFPDARLLPASRRLAIGTLVAALLISGAMLLLDARGVAFAATLPLWVVDTFNELTDFGKSQWFLIPIGIVIVAAAFLASPAAGRVANLVLTSLIVRLGYVFIAIALPGLIVTFAYMPWSWKAAFASMPSGHSATAAAAAVAIGLLWPKARVPMLIYAMVIFASRVIIHAHFVSDVMTGAFVGGFGAILVRNWFAARGLAFVPSRDGSVHAMPGPSWSRVKAVARRLLGQ